MKFYKEFFSYLKIMKEKTKNKLMYEKILEIRKCKYPEYYITNCLNISLK